MCLHNTLVLTYPTASDSLAREGELAIIIIPHATHCHNTTRLISPLLWPLEMVATVASLPPNILTSNLVPTEPSAHSSLNDPHMSNSPHPFPPVLDRKPVLSSGGSISGPINLLADVALDSSISATSFQKPSITLPLSSPSGAHPGGPHPHDQERLPNVRAGDRRGSLVLEHPGYERSLAGGHSRVS